MHCICKSIGYRFSLNCCIVVLGICIAGFVQLCKCNYRPVFFLGFFADFVYFLTHLDGYFVVIVGTYISVISLYNTY